MPKSARSRDAARADRHAPLSLLIFCLFAAATRRRRRRRQRWRERCRRAATHFAMILLLFILPPPLRHPASASRPRCLRAAPADAAVCHYAMPPLRCRCRDAEHAGAMPPAYFQRALPSPRAMAATPLCLSTERPPGDAAADYSSRRAAAMLASRHDAMLSDFRAMPLT